jgi:methylase of polypeptide subunit release factors
VLAGLLVGGDVDAALDLGTGSGLLAMMLAGQARTVVATDVNPAAVRYAELGARLNGLAQVEVRTGSFFEPVGEARFDRILSNPPFVISPDSSLLFRYSTLERDDVSRTVIDGAAEHLADDGIAAILCNWIVPRGSSWLEAIRPWVEARGCDAIVLLHGVEDPLSYAVRWNGRAQYVAPAEFPHLLDRWLEYDRTQGIEAIASGAVILRRRSGTNWTHGLELEGESSGAGGPQIAALLDAMDYLAGTADEDILRRAFRLTAAHRLDQSLAMHDGEYVVGPARLILDETIGTIVDVEPDLIPVVLRLDGSQVVRDIVDEVAAATGADPADFATRAVALVRAMLERGVLRAPHS